MSKQLAEYSIAELLLSFIAYEVSQFDEKKILHTNMKIQVVEQLLNNFNVENDIEVPIIAEGLMFNAFDSIKIINNSMWVLKELVSRLNVIVDGNELSAQIVNKSTIQLLSSHVESNVCFSKLQEDIILPNNNRTCLLVWPLAHSWIQLSHIIILRSKQSIRSQVNP